ncbi:Cytosolic Fe-S cluster assembly factor nar1 [Taxawa tesnikishii (nom. ined.)]|nr:Cytosolic Fe-S cluster assembly factor nar1 [Dothideales sp. JES 119]
MSAILSADGLNDFISPESHASSLLKHCPNNNLPLTTEDKVAAANAPPASISLTDCLACSGCVTSAEAVLVSLQSHAEVLNTLDAYPDLPLPWTHQSGVQRVQERRDGKLFVASVSPQTRASIAATYRVTEREAGNMIAQLLSGPQGLRSGGKQKSGFTWILDTNIMREAGLVAAADEVQQSLQPQEKPSSEMTGTRLEQPKKPILASACPGWICYAEKTHPHVLPHISRLKSPQALTGTLLKSVLASRYGINPDQVWHMAVMPCFDKKLEASREELTDVSWKTADGTTERKGIRDTDCVITARELLMLADARGISFPLLPRKPLRQAQRVPFPDSELDRFLFPPSRSRDSNTGGGKVRNNGIPDAGTSGGYLWHIMQTYRSQHPGSEIRIQRGRNADVVEYALVDPLSGETVIKSARYYGFRNIQNLVRRLKPAKPSRMPGAAARGGARRPGGGGGGAAGHGMTEYAYVEVMACPGGCTNGGGQIKGGEAVYTNGENNAGEDVVDGINRREIKGVLRHWAELTGIDLDRLLYTSYRKVESDVGKSVGDVERVAGLASSIGGGW